VKDWSVTWEGIFIGRAMADSAEEAIRLMQVRYPHIPVIGTWAAVELP
jgi:hypothetical protein